MKTYQSFGKVYHTRSILRKNFDSHYKNILTLMYALSSWRLAIIEIELRVLRNVIFTTSAIITTFTSTIIIRVVESC